MQCFIGVVSTPLGLPKRCGICILGMIVLHFSMQGEDIIEFRICEGPKLDAESILESHVC